MPFLVSGYCLCFTPSITLFVKVLSYFSLFEVLGEASHTPELIASYNLFFNSITCKPIYFSIFVNCFHVWCFSFLFLIYEVQSVMSFARNTTICVFSSLFTRCRNFSFT